MMFVPVVPPTAGTSPPSPRTRELAALLQKVVEEYSAAHPAVTPAEVRRAVQMTQMSVQGGNRKLALVVVAGLSVMVALLVAGLALFSQGTMPTSGGPWPLAVFGIMVLVAVAMVVLKLVSR